MQVVFAKFEFGFFGSVFMGAWSVDGKWWSSTNLLIYVIKVAKTSYYICLKVLN